jgi:ubiquinone/menaquinone biosynthesis C-methylase UbiE
MISEKLLRMMRCPKTGEPLVLHSDHLQCPTCGDKFHFKPGDAYIDMRPPGVAQKDSVYGNEEFVIRKGLMTPGPPFLSGGIKNWVLSRMMRFEKGDDILDGGCGPGRYILWNKKSGAYFVGIDQEPYFAKETIEASDLVQGCLHYMPFKDGYFDHIICLDVLEHMALDDIRKFLNTSQRILKKDGRLFIYTNSVESSVLAPVIRFRQKITALFVKWGKIDMKIEKESKEDHINAIKTRTQLIELAEKNGLMLSDSAYYNPVIMGWVENLFIKIAEGHTNGKIRNGKIKKSGGNEKFKTSNAKVLMKEKVKRKGAAYFLFLLLTQIMKLDILFFSSIEGGQFFLVFNKNS